MTIVEPSTTRRSARAVIGLAWVALVIAAEGWYRTGAAKGRLAGRVARLVTAEVVVLLLGVALLRFTS